MSNLPATAYVVCSYLWATLVLGICTYLVFWKDHSGWWYVLAIFLCANSTASNAAKINGTWRKGMDPTD
jgi:hypothetical protein